MMTVIDKDGVPTKDYMLIMCYQRIIILQDFNNPNNKPEETEESFKTMSKLKTQCYVMSGQLELAVTLLKKTGRSKSFPTSGRNHTSVV